MTTFRAWIARLLAAVARAFGLRLRARRLLVYVGPSVLKTDAVRVPRLSTKWRMAMPTIVIGKSHKRPFRLQPVDVAGEPARVDGAPVWASSDPSIVTVETVDGLSGFIVPVGGAQALGDPPVQVTVTADADLGEGVRSLTESIAVFVDAEEATSLGLVVGDPEPK